MDHLIAVCRESQSELLRAAFPLTTRWTLYHTIPRLVGETVRLAFAPLHTALEIGRILAVQSQRIAEAA